jgi:hypothetical protein
MNDNIDIEQIKYLFFQRQIHFGTSMGLERDVDTRPLQLFFNLIENVTKKNDFKAFQETILSFSSYLKTKNPDLSFFPIPSSFFHFCFIILTSNYSLFLLNYSFGPVLLNILFF